MLTATIADRMTACFFITLFPPRSFFALLPELLLVSEKLAWEAKGFVRKVFIGSAYTFLKLSPFWVGTPKNFVE
jgi:hypothetical protein